MSNCKTVKEALCVSEVLYDNLQEQRVEPDIVLPDYLPEVFKVLSLELTSGVTSQSMSGNKLCFDIEVEALLLYCSEEGKICSVSSRATYARTAEVAYAVKAPQISINTSTLSQSYRVTSKRRVAISGVIGAAIKITQDVPVEAVSVAEGSGLEVLREQVTYPSKRILVSKHITIADEAELPTVKSAIGSILRAEAVSITHDRKVLSGKLLIKGEAQVSVWYLPEEGEVPQTLGIALPFSQILDIEALDERYEIYTETKAKSCTASASSRGDARSIAISIDLEVSCRAVKFDTKEFALDAFSTNAEVELTPLEIEIESTPTTLNTAFKKKATLTYKDGEIGEVIAVSGRVTGMSYRAIGNELIVRGKLNIGAIACDESGRVIYLDTAGDFEETVALDNAEAMRVCLSAEVAGMQYNIASSNSVDVTAQIKLCGYTAKVNTKRLIGDISVTEQEANPTEYGLKLYYTSGGESVWEIAKRCHTSPKGIRVENGIEGDSVEGARVLLVPYYN